jgi:hypothetical protein
MLKFRSFSLSLSSTIKSQFIHFIESEFIKIFSRSNLSDLKLKF